MVVVPPSLIGQEHNLPAKRASITPNDTRYPLPALAAGALGGVALGAAALAVAPVGWAIGVGAIVGLLLGTSIKIADQWEKAVVLRLGKYRGLKGPGGPGFDPEASPCSR